SQIGTVTLSSDIYRNAALAVLLGELFLWYWLVTGDGFHVTGTTIKNYLAALSSISESGLSLLSSIGGLLHNRRYEALVFKKNAGKYVGNYNYSSLRSFTRRADMVLVAELGFRGEVALHIFDYVQRV